MIGEKAEMGVVPLNDCFDYIPNMRALHPDTKVQVFREYKQDKGLVEVTIFYREPGKNKQRIDLEMTPKLDDEEYNVEDFKIVQWGSAIRPTE